MNQKESLKDIIQSMKYSSVDDRFLSQGLCSMRATRRSCWHNDIEPEESTLATGNKPSPFRSIVDEMTNIVHLENEKLEKQIQPETNIVEDMVMKKIKLIQFVDTQIWLFFHQHETKTLMNML